MFSYLLKLITHLQSHKAHNQHEKVFFFFYISVIPFIHQLPLE